jgi:hypothetical protein
MAELRLVVERLREPPFRHDLSLVALDEKTPVELLQLLNDVLTELDDRHKLDIRDEPDDIRGKRIADFLTVLKFKVPKGKE